MDLDNLLNGEIRPAWLIYGMTPCIPSALSFPSQTSHLIRVLPARRHPSGNFPGSKISHFRFENPDNPRFLKSEGEFAYQAREGQKWCYQERSSLKNVKKNVKIPQGLD
jgi:hypothetical protein